jgi:hypothetical protein
MCVNGIDFVSAFTILILDNGAVRYLVFSVRYWNCSDRLVFVVFLLDIGAVQTVRYLLLFC